MYVKKSRHFGAKCPILRSLLSDPSLKTINKTYICKNKTNIYINKTIIYINKTIICTNITFIYTFLRGGRSLSMRWKCFCLGILSIFLPCLLLLYGTFSLDDAYFRYFSVKENKWKDYEGRCRLYLASSSEDNGSRVVINR